MRARDSIETEVPDNGILMMELRGDLLMHALVSNNVTFEIGINIAYTVRPEIRQCQSQDRLAGRLAGTECIT